MDAMIRFFTGWAFTAVSLVGIGLVFLLGYLRLAAELRWTRVLTDHLGARLVGGEPDAPRPPPSLMLVEIRDQVEAVETSTDPVWSQRQVRAWQMRSQRLEPALAFWVDLLRQLGLLGTVLGLGISLATGTADPARLLGPLGLAVWTTVVGLSTSIWLSARFSGQLAAWADACEKNLEAWDGRRRPGGAR
jgi:hypothetical protein